MFVGCGIERGAILFTFFQRESRGMKHKEDDVIKSERIFQDAPKCDTVINGLFMFMIFRFPSLKDYTTRRDAARRGADEGGRKNALII
jgi:hypothetical protein